MNIVRRGPGIILVKSEDCSKTRAGLDKYMPTVMSFENNEAFGKKYTEGIGLSDADDTFVLIVKTLEDNVNVKLDEIDSIFLVNLSITDCMINIFNHRDEMGILKVRRSIDRLMMRATGNTDEFIEAVRKDVDGEILPVDQFFESYLSGTFISFTEKGLNNPVDYPSHLEKVVRTSIKRYEALELLENNRLKYVNASIENKDWTALNIKIYDSYEQFELHYKRLVQILESMDAGLVLGESWGKDSAVMFLSVGVYSVRLYTYLDPVEIKKILLGLEYKDDGKRVVDYDLFLKRRKIHWNDARVDQLSREQLGHYYRKELVSKLNEGDLKDLLELEKDIKEE